MAGIKPIGSEKLDGMDKIRRIMQIARYNENIPNPINETAKSEYSIELSNGNTYEIFKERQGYIIKESTYESSEYLKPIQNRKYYSSYSQALKKINLMANEFNSLHENEEGTSLFNEQKKKYVLKKTKSTKLGDTSTNQITPPPPVDAGIVGTVPPPPVDAGIEGDMPPPPVDAGIGGSVPPPPVDAGFGGDMPPPVDADMGGDMPPPPVDSDIEGDMPPPPVDADMEGDMPPPPVDSDMEGDIDGSQKSKGPSDFKRIQILVGKLAQKIRTYEENENLSPKDVKYVINSILSAIDVNVLDEDDIEQIISKLEGEEDEDDDGNDNENFGGEDEDENLASNKNNEEPSGEMEESYPNYNNAFNDIFKSAYSKSITDDLTEDDYNETENNISNWYDNQIEGNFFKQNGHHRGGFNDEMRKIKNYDYKKNDQYFDETNENEENHNVRRRGSIDYNRNTYNESKIDKIISGYFLVSENEIKKKYKGLIENEFQLKSVIEIHKNNPKIKFIGKTNKGNLLFKNGLNESKVTKSGTII